jgi:RNA polymerase sigma factor (sigma-70 family)
VDSAGSGDMACCQDSGATRLNESTQKNIGRDGWNVELSDAQQREILGRYRRWIYAMVREMAPRLYSEWEDLAQEAWISIWKALKTYDPELGAEATYLTTAARMRVTDVLRRHIWTGTPSIRGHRREEPATPVDTDWDWVDDQSTYIENRFDDALMAYHHGEIADALSKLSAADRTYVEHHVMMDLGQPERWRNKRIRAQLQPLLQHLLE